MERALNEYMTRAAALGLERRSQQEAVCRARRDHRLTPLPVGVDVVFHYCEDCLLLFVNRVPVNSVLDA
jgi:hypothetical protein